MRTLCAEAGFKDADELDLLRWGANITFVHRPAGVVFRAAPPGTPLGSLSREVAVARFLASVGYPAVRLSDVWVDQPVETSAGAVTVWRYIPGRPGGEDDYALLGDLLSRLHALTPLAVALPWARDVESDAVQLDQVRERAQSTGLLREHAFLLDAVAEFLTGDGSPLSTDDGELVLCHGDAHPGNIIVGSSGAVLADLEYAGTAAREWDLSEALVHVQRFGVPRSCWDDLLGSYGYDEVDPALLRRFVRSREVKLAAWTLVRGLRTGVGLAEARRRTDALMSGDLSIRWQRV